jgi:dienelactone hydrolase
VRYESQARYFARKGFVVLVPTRVGYGTTGQDFDPEDSNGTGKRKDYRLIINAASTQILAAIDYGRTLPGVDGKRIVLVGQSVGGFSTVAAASQNPPGLVVAINFAGGAGGDPDQHPGVPMEPDQLKDLYAEMGKAANVPNLNASGREGYQKFLQAESPRAFAISSDHHWGYVHGDDALARALANCQRGGANDARLYAVDGDVVW